MIFSTSLRVSSHLSPSLSLSLLPWLLSPSLPLKSWHHPRLSSLSTCSLAGMTPRGGWGWLPPNFICFLPKSPAKQTRKKEWGEEEKKKRSKVCVFSFLSKAWMNTCFKDFVISIGVIWARAGCYMCACNLEPSAPPGLLLLLCPSWVSPCCLGHFAHCHNTATALPPSRCPINAFKPT